MKFLQSAKQREAVAHLASMLENAKFEKAMAQGIATLPQSVADSKTLLE